MKDSKFIQREPIAIIGTGCFFPGSQGFEEFWSFVKSGTDGITDVPASHWNADEFFNADPKQPDMVYSKTGGFLSPIKFHPGDYGIAPNNIEATDTSQLLGLLAAKQALENAGYQSGVGEPAEGLRTWDRSRASVILGVTGTLELVIPLGARLGHPRWRKALKNAGVDDATANRVMEDIAESYVPWQENSFPGLLGNVVAGRIANRLDLGGTNCVVDAACASSLGAVHLAALELWAGRSDMVITGGVDTFNDIFMFMCFSKTPALSPTGHSRPFDAEGDGTALGEGLGLVVLKRLSDAEKAGDKIIAVLRSVGSSSDGKGGAVYAPKAEGQMKALQAAYKEANISVDTIELVEAHGTGTKVGDATELSSLMKVYADRDDKASPCAVGSVKSQIGHTKAAAGAAGLIKAAAALFHKTIPPSIKVRKPLEGLLRGQSSFYLASKKRPWVGTSSHPRRAAISAFGFGGSNFHCVLEEYNPEKLAPDWDGKVQILALSAPSREELIQKLQALPSQQSWSAWRKLCSQLRKVFQADEACRCLIVAQQSDADLGQKVQKAIDQLKKGGIEALAAPGVFFGSGKKQGKLAFLFSGQGAQYPAMFLDLACLFPQFLDALKLAHKVQEDISPNQPRLADLIFPLPGYSEQDQARDVECLRRTDVAQPALGAVELGAYKVLKHFGLAPDFSAGHSFGELSALACAGVISERDLMALSFARGRFMAEASVGAGGMLAVLAPENEVQTILKSGNISLVSANRNSAKQIVLAGPVDQIDKAALLLGQKGLVARKLQVGGAFHSPMVADAQMPFASFVNEQVGWNRFQHPVYSNTYAKPYPENFHDGKAVLAAQLARSVEFQSMIQAMHLDGGRIFIEVGPGGRLVGLVSEILAGKDHVALALDASQGKKPGEYDLALLLAKLSALGHRLELSKWDDSQMPAEENRQGFHVELTGANYVRPKPSKFVSKPKIESKAPVEPKIEKPVEVKKVPSQPMIPENKPTPVTSKSMPSDGLLKALEVTKSSLDMLQKLQEQSTQIHQMFLQGQQVAQRNLQALIEQQQAVLQASLGLVPVFSRQEPVAVQPVQRMVSAPLTVPSHPVQVVQPVQPSHLPAVIESPKPTVVPVIQAPKALPTPTPVHVEPVVIPVAKKQEAPIVSQTPAAATPSNSGKITKALIEVVSEKTGYPVEMLDLNMSMDADLGIDSIKRVEILAALQEKLPEAPIVKPEHLGTLNTLKQVADFLNGGKSPAIEQTKVVEPAREIKQETIAAPLNKNLEPVLLEVVSEKTGYPVEMLDLNMSMDADLGIDSIKRVEILAALQEKLPEAPIVKPEHLGTLNTLKQVLEHLSNGPGTMAKPPVPSMKETPLPKHLEAPDLILDLDRLAPKLTNASEKKVKLSVTSTVIITGEDSALALEICKLLAKRGMKAEKMDLEEVRRSRWDDIGGLIVLAPVQKVHEVFLEQALLAVQSAGKGLRSDASRQGKFLFGITRLDGGLGFVSYASEHTPVQAGLCGLMKTAAREWPEVRARILDIDPAMDVSNAAEKIVDEIFFAGPLEVGITSDHRRTIALEKSTIIQPEIRQDMKDGLVVVTGGARGVTAECAYAMAVTRGCSLLLLGRTPEPQPEPDWLEGLRSEAEIKKELASRSTGGASPRVIGEKCRQILADREVRDNLVKIRNLGVTVFYHAADIRDAGSVREAIQDVVQKAGPITGIIHGAGVLADAMIEDKTLEQFQKVYQTKVLGIQNILSQVDGSCLKFICLFSSTTARFGRPGQVDYSMSNEVLNKLAQSFARRHPSCRVVSFNWGPWDGGMVHEGLKKIFQKEGIGLIPLKQGASLLVSEIQNQSADVEISVLRTGSQVPTESENTAVNKLQGYQESFERKLDLEGHPFLEHHVFDGRPVLPMAVILEWLAHAAIHQHPGYQFAGCEDFRILHGVICDQQESWNLRFNCGEPVVHDGTLVVPVEMRGTRTSGKEVLHARAEIHLAEQLGATPSNIRSITAPKVDYSIESLYQEVLFHGPMMQPLEVVESCGERGIVSQIVGAPDPSAWIRQPLRQKWIVDPLAVDAVLQLMIVWTTKNQGMGSLPCRIGNLRLFKKPFANQKLRAIVEMKKANDLHAVADVDLVDSNNALVMRLEGVEGVLDSSLSRAFRRNRSGKTALHG